jgi:SAM-dependent methyltransferase
MKGLLFLLVLLVISFSDAFTSTTVKGVSVHPVPLRQNDDASPYCYAASSIVDLKPTMNFLATQVWPSARVASLALERHVNKDWTVCEFGCGPGLPSLTAAILGCKVYATDIDEFALDLVQAAAQSQQHMHAVQTRRVDLIQGFETKDKDWIQDIDLFLFSDVFENGQVAQGAARITQHILQTSKAKVWVFAQSDRAQREVYLQELQQTINPKLSWEPIDSYNERDQLWLCDLDETTVSYG